MHHKTLFIVAGCNGAGKSTLSRYMLPKALEGVPVFDGDQPFTQRVKEAQAQKTGASLKEIKEEASIYANGLFTSAYKEAISTEASFVYEGHFTDKGQWMPLIDFKNAGYRVEMQYIGLKNVETSLARVGQRVSTGGHSVDPANVAHNFYLNAGNVDKNHVLFDKLLIWDGEGGAGAMKPLIITENGKVIDALPQKELPPWIGELMPAISKKVAAFNINRREKLGEGVEGSAGGQEIKQKAPDGSPQVSTQKARAKTRKARY